MVHVTTDAVRRRLKLSEEDITDNDVMAFIEDAAACISEEIDELIDPKNCSKSEYDAIANLAAIYSYCHITGGTFSGTDFSVGDFRVTEQPRDLTSQLNFLKGQIERFITSRKEKRKKHGISLLEGP